MVFDKIAKKISSEKATWVGKTILAPGGGEIVIALMGLNWRIKTDGHCKGLCHWEIDAAGTMAKCVREATLGEMRTVFAKLPHSPFIYLGDNVCHVFNLADKRFGMVFEVENPLAVNPDLFAVVNVCFWGSHKYLLNSTNRNGQTARRLRSHFYNKTHPRQLVGIDGAYRSAYYHLWTNFNPRVIPHTLALKNPTGYIQDALEKGGASLVNIEARDGVWVIEYTFPKISKATYTATFDTNFTLINPGLCFQASQPVGITEFVALVQNGLVNHLGDW